MHIKYLERSNFLKIIRRGSYLIFPTIILALEMQKKFNSYSYNTLTDKRSTQRFSENQQMVFIFGINDICGNNLNFLLSEIFSRLINKATIYAFGLIKLTVFQNHSNQHFLDLSFKKTQNFGLKMTQNLISTQNLESKQNFHST